MFTLQFGIVKHLKYRTIMKKIFTAIVALMLAAPSFAQYSSGGFTLDEENVYYGVRIGMTGAGLGGDIDGLGTRVGMTLAGVVGLRVSSTTPVFLESGLYYTERGAKKDKTVISLNYLEVPLLIKYGFKATDDIAVLPFIGPYFSYGISGKYKYPVPGGAVESHSVYGDNGNIKHGEMGFKLGCGAEYNKLYLELGYQFGVSNISKVDEIDAHGHAFFCNFGVNF